MKNLALQSLINKALETAFGFPTLKKMMEDAYELGRKDERARCNEIAKRIQKALPR